MRDAQAPSPPGGAADGPAARPARSAWLPAAQVDDDALAGALRAALLLALEGAAAALGVASVVLGRHLPALFGRNALPPSTRTQLLVAMLLGAAAPVAAVLLVLRRDRARIPRALRAAASLALPVLPLAVYPALLHTQPWFQKPLEYLLVLGAFALLLERCLVPALAALPPPLGSAFTSAGLAASAADERRRRLAPFVVVVVAAAAYAAYTSYLTILNHHRFGTGAFDLAIYDNLMANALRGHPFRSTVMYGTRAGSSLAGHAEYGMLLFLPLYALHPAAETLLVLQAVLLGGAAVPLYLFATTMLPRWQAAAVALLYLLYAPLHAPQFYDFHWLPLATPFFFLLCWAIARRRDRLMIVTLLVLYSLREDVAVGVAAIGLYLLVASDRPRLGAVLAGVSAVWFAVNKFVIMPAFGSWWFEAFYKDLVAPGEKGWGSIIKTMLVNPVYVATTLLTQAKLEYALQLLAPLAFLPLRRPRLLLLLIPGFLFTLMTTGYGPSTSIKYQYTTHWIAFLFAATVLALRALGDVGARRRVAAQVALAAAVLSHSVVFGVVLAPSSFIGGILPIQFSMTAPERQRYGDLRRLGGMVPRNASLSITDYEAPHFSARADVFAIAQDDSAGEYLLVGVESLPLAATRANLAKLLSTKPYGLLARAGSRLFLFRQGHQNPETQAAIDELRRL